MKPSFDGVVERQYQYFLEEWDGDDDPPSFEEWLEEEEEMDAARDVYYSSEEYAEAMDEAEESRRNPMTEDKSPMYRNIGLLTASIGVLYWLKDK